MDFRTYRPLEGTWSVLVCCHSCGVLRGYTCLREERHLRLQSPARPPLISLAVCFLRRTQAELRAYIENYPGFGFQLNTFGFGYSLDSQLLFDLAVAGNGASFLGGVRAVALSRGR